MSSGGFTHVFNKKRKSSKGGPFSRSNDYRREYLKKHKGFFGIYTCAYCGRLCTRSTMQVDHIYPVNGVKGLGAKGTSGKLFVTLVSLFHGPKALKEGVNADWNKTAACPRCNSNKTDNMGLWVLRGYFGKILFPIMNFAITGGLAYGGINALITGSPAVLYKMLAITAIVKIGLFLLSSKKKKRR